MPTQDTTARRATLLPGIAAGAWLVALSALTILGSDLMWVVALGDVVRDTGSIPQGVPFASAAQTDWPNPVVLAQLLLSLVNAAGWWALPAFHLALVATCLAVVAVDARRLGGGAGLTAVVLGLVVVGASSAFVVVRFPSLSLVPFVVLVLLLRWAVDRPGRQVWVVPPLMVLWGNLHGAVLVGLAVLGVWVVLGRGPRLLHRTAVGVLSLGALLVTSAGIRTPAYYVSALRNEAAVRGTDLWAAPSLGHPLDLAMLLAAAALVVLAARHLRLWEWVVVAGLVAGTLAAARNGVWLVLFLAPVATLGWRGRRTVVPVRATLPGLSGLAVVGVVTAALVGLVFSVRAPQLRPPGHEAVGPVAALAGSAPVLAVEPEAETFAQAGIRVWAANPIDAFTRRTQGEFLDFLHECRVPDAPDVAVVVVTPRCRQALVEQGWVGSGGTGDLLFFTRAG